MSELREFDPGDPFDAMAERFRREVTMLALSAERTTIYHDLAPQRQLECFIAGALTGIIGVAFASIQSEGRDYMMEYIAQNLPAARFFAEAVRPREDAGA